MVGLSTLCYLEKDNKYLMLHRIKEKKDINKGKWIGIGGHFEENESPEECIVREVKEETGYTLNSWKYRAIITFISQKGITEYVSLFTSDDFFGEEIECDEGFLKWIDKDKILDLNLWEGDKIFLELINKQEEFFSLKMVYDENDKLIEAILNGEKIDF